MILERVEQISVIGIRHFTGILLSVPCAEKIRRVCIDQHIRIIEPGDHFDCRAILDLDPAQPFRSLFDALGSITPSLGCISRFPSLYIVFPANLDLVCPNAVPHHQLCAEDDGTLKAVPNSGLISICRPVIDLS